MSNVIKFPSRKQVVEKVDVVSPLPTFDDFIGSINSTLNTTMLPTYKVEFSDDEVVTSITKVQPYIELVNMPAYIFNWGPEEEGGGRTSEHQWEALLTKFEFDEAGEALNVIYLAFAEELPKEVFEYLLQRELNIAFC